MNEICLIIDVLIVSIIAFYEMIMIDKKDDEITKLEKKNKELKQKVKIWKKEALKRKKKY